MKKVYLVLPVYNEEEVLSDSCAKLKELMEGMVKDKIITPNSRVVFVNDGSTDLSMKILRDISSKDNLFIAISLAHNVGHQNAILAGMLTVKDECDAVITLDADLQHDINMIPEFIKKYEEGYEIVYGVRKSREGEGLFKKISGDAFYSIMGFFGTNVIRNHADYRLLSSKALRALDKYKEVNLFLRGIIPRIGFSHTILEYEEKPRLAGKSKYSLSKMLKLASDGITSFSIKPLQAILGFGFLFFGVSIVMMLDALISMIKGNVVPGWTSMEISIWMLGGVQLLSLGVVGEYIGKMYMETKHRPRYEIDVVIKDCEEKEE